MIAAAVLVDMLRQFFPPDLSLSYLRALLTPLLQTLEMAAGGMLIAVAAGLVAGIWVAAKVPGARIVYSLLGAFRSIPDLTMAIFCVVVVGIGPAAGMLALAIFYSAAVGKIFADLFRSADPHPLDSLRATGATRLSVAFFGFIPLRLKDVLSYGAYEFESAIRASVIVGAVGGGGLGTEIVGSINGFEYRRGTTLILLLIVLIAVVDQFGYLLKRRPGILFLVMPAAAFACWNSRPQIIALSHSATTFATMLPPVLSRSGLAQLPLLIGETLEIAFGGTLLAVLAALPLGLLAARNFSPPFISLPLRRVLEALRAVPELVSGLILVALIGIGPKAGILALGLHSAGSLGRLYAESFENILEQPVHAIAATGASRFAIAGFAYLPLAAAPIAVHTLFRTEWNMRAATVVGVIGAGGIGQALFNAQQLFFYKQMMAYVLVTGVLVAVVDSGSTFVRKRMHLMDVYA